MDLLLNFLQADFLGKAAWVWLTFLGVVVTLLAFDLGVLHKDDHEIGVRLKALNDQKNMEHTLMLLAAVL